MKRRDRKLLRKYEGWLASHGVNYYGLGHYDGTRSEHRLVLDSDEDEYRTQWHSHVLTSYFELISYIKLKLGIRKQRYRARCNMMNRRYYENKLKAACNENRLNYYVRCPDTRHRNIQVVLFTGELHLDLELPGSKLIQDEQIVYRSKFYGNPVNAVCATLKWIKENYDQCQKAAG